MLLEINRNRGKGLNMDNNNNGNGKENESAIVIGFKKIWETDNLVTYHVIKLTETGKKEFIDFPIDKRPEMFDTIKVTNESGYNKPESVQQTERSKESVSSRLYDFIANNWDKFEDLYDPMKPITEGGYIEGIASEVTKRGKINVRIPDGTIFVAYAHELINHTDVAKGDRVRVVGDLNVDKHEIYAYVLACEKYVPEVKEQKETVKAAKDCLKGIDDCTPSPKPANPTQNSTQSNTVSAPKSNGNGKGFVPPITRSGYELTAEGLSYFADKLRDDLKIKVIRGSKRDMREIFVWKDGFYISGGDQDIEEAVKDELQELYEAKWFTIVYNHIVSKGSIEMWQFTTPKRTINIENGILTYPNNKVIFTPRIHPLQFNEMNFRYKLPVSYDPDAKCDNIEAIIEQILIDKSIDSDHIHKINDISWIEKLSPEELADPDNQEEIQESLQEFREIKLGKDPRVAKVFTYYEFLGLCLMSEYDFKKTLFLLGFNNTGKSTLANIPRKLVGERNCATVELSKLDSNNDCYASADLENKFLNVVEELSPVTSKSFETFKAATSGSPIRVQRKYKDGHTMQNFAKFLYCANETPDIAPKVFRSTLDRIVAIECTNKFLSSDKTTKAELQHQDFKPEELSGLLNIAIKGLERLLASGGKFTAYDDTETASLWNKYNTPQENNPIKKFLANSCTISGDYEDTVARKELWKTYATENKIEVEDKQLEREFSTSISHIKDQVVDDNGKPTGKYITIQTKRIGDVRYWTGIKLNSSMALVLNPESQDESNENQAEEGN
jgi:phage/plasmid-associated DNA primase